LSRAQLAISPSRPTNGLQVSMTGARAGPEFRRERLVVLDVERREHHFVPGPDPDASQRAADLSGPDDADFHLPPGRCTRQRR
jgi:hypothetical protein